MKIFRKQKGFTLLEVMIALVIVTIVVTQVMVLSQSSQRANLLSGQRLQAYYVAMEQKEIMRAMYLNNKFKPPCNNCSTSVLTSEDEQWKNFLNGYYVVDNGFPDNNNKRIESLASAWGENGGEDGFKDSATCWNSYDYHDVLAGCYGPTAYFQNPALNITKYNIKVTIYHNITPQADTKIRGYPDGVTTNISDYARAEILVTWPNPVHEGQKESVSMDYYMTKGMD